MSHRCVNIDRNRLSVRNVFFYMSADVKLEWFYVYNKKKLKSFNILPVMCDSSQWRLAAASLPSSWARGRLDLRTCTSKRAKEMQTSLSSDVRRRRCDDWSVVVDHRTEQPTIVRTSAKGWSKGKKKLRKRNVMLNVRLRQWLQAGIRSELKHL